ncbi:NAD(P)H-hydrate dehydratase [bacterium]|nr:NAD(P)H-hydrate dehydratase [bacterium]
MTEFLSAAQMRAAEAAAMGAVTGLDLMERAGAGVVEAVLDAWPELSAGLFRAVVLCGPGNNGGDGYVIARLLLDRGWQVEVFALAPPATSDARAMRALWGGPVADFAALTWEGFERADVVVDAVFGTGLGRPLAPGVWGALEMARRGRRLVAVDVPSGLCADSGRVLAEGEAPDWPADLTVTFGAAKLGHVLDQGPSRCGRLRVVPIGVEDEVRALLRSDPAGVVEAASASRDLAKGQGHKFSHGHALVLCGPPGRGGAARMSARGALRIGAGLVTLACPPGALAENAGRLDAIMLKPVADAADLREVLADPRISALCLGPGLGLDDRTHDLVSAAVQDGRPLVLDADALTLLARDAALFAALHKGCVLTPHAGEFARLFPDIAAPLQAPATRGPACSKVDATRAAAARAGCVVLFKGADTVIAAPDGTCAINAAHYDRAAPWLATAGAGDVLAGFIAGLLARGFPPLMAAESAAWLHVEAARSFGPGLIAEDLPEELPKVLRAL